MCHCLTACCTYMLLHSGRQTGCMDSSLQRVQGGWADLGSKSFYSHSNVLVLLPAASQQPLGHIHSECRPMKPLCFADRIARRPAEELPFRVCDTMQAARLQFASRAASNACTCTQEVAGIGLWTCGDHLRSQKQEGSRCSSRQRALSSHTDRAMLSWTSCTCSSISMQGTLQREHQAWRR